MNATEFVSEDNSITVKPDYNRKLDPDWGRIYEFQRVFPYVYAALGIPGNILSAIVWLRLHKKNSSAVYLAALAIIDLVFLLNEVAFKLLFNALDRNHWLLSCLVFMFQSLLRTEPLLVLGFSVERLLAICWPLKVGLRLLSLAFYVQKTH